MTPLKLSGTEFTEVYVPVFKSMIQKLSKHKINPKLVVLSVGDDPASRIYVRQKEKRAQQIGMAFEWIQLPTETSQSDLLSYIDKLNRSTEASGFIVQFPLPDHLDEEEVSAAIDPAKDVDGFHPLNKGDLMEGSDHLQACTPAGIIHLLDHYQIPIAGKEVVIVNRSQIVGLPLSMMLIHRDATVTVCHSRTTDLKQHVQRADIVVTAIGQPGVIQLDWFKDQAVLIDVSMNRNPAGKLVGDVDVSNRQALDRLSAYTPIPGGVGPMTVMTLMMQTIQAACQQNGLEYHSLLKECLDDQANRTE